MKVYLLIESNFNGCDCFESVHSVYTDPDVAIYAQLVQEEKNLDKVEWLSFFIRTENVIELMEEVEL